MAIEIVDLPINSMVVFHSYVSLPEGMCWLINIHTQSSSSPQLVSSFRPWNDPKEPNERVHCYGDPMCLEEALIAGISKSYIYMQYNEHIKLIISLCV